MSRKVAGCNKKVLTEQGTGAGTTKRVYKVSEIQEILGISNSAAYNLVGLGLFRSVRIGSSIRISRKSFDRWLGKQIGVDLSSVSNG